MTAPKSTKNTGDRAHPSTARPRTVPAAGGCSVLNTTIISMLRPTAATAIKSLVMWDSTTNPPTRVSWSRTTPPPRNHHGDDVPAYHPVGGRYPAVRHHEYGEGAGRDRDDDGCLDHDIHDQHDSQQGQQGQRALAEVVPPVPANLAVDQRLFVRRVPHRLPYVWCVPPMGGVSSHVAPRMRHRSRCHLSARMLRERCFDSAALRLPRGCLSLRHRGKDLVSRGLKLLRLAAASISVPSTVKGSSDRRLRRSAARTNLSNGCWPTWSSGRRCRLACGPLTNPR